MNNDLIHINTLPPFKRMCVSIGNLPTSFMESMTYYEALCWLYDYFEKTLLPAINNNSAAITELQEAFVTLKNYIDNYFENLDVTEEINNKLDEMAESGQLNNLIKSYIDPIYEAYETEINANIANQNAEINSFKSSVNSTIDNFDTRLNAVTSGNPLAASSTAGMTDTSRIYVNTTDGKWYYYDGNSWEIGGTYQSTEIGNGTVTYDNLESELKKDYDPVTTTTEALPTLNKIISSDGSETTLSNAGYYELNVNPFESYKIHMNYDTTNIYSSSNMVRTMFKNDSTVISYTTAADTPTLTNFYYDEIINIPYNANKLIINTSRLSGGGNGNYITKIDKYVHKNIAKEQLDNKLQTFFNNIYTEVTPTLYLSSVYLGNDRDFHSYTSCSVYTVSVNPGENYRVSGEQVYTNPFIFFSTNNGEYTTTFSGNDYVMKNTPEKIISETSSYKFSNYTFTIPQYCNKLYISKYTNDSRFKLEKVTGYKVDISGLDIQSINPLTNKTLCFLGDSIIAATSAGVKGWVQLLSENNTDTTFYNYGHDGYTIAKAEDSWSSRSIQNILETVLSEHPTTDYIIFQGGVNDYYGSDHGITLGEISTGYNPANFDRTTFSGGMEYIINYLYSNFPGTKIAYIVTQQIYASEFYQFMDRAKEICKKWSVPFIDLFDEGNINFHLSYMRNDFSIHTESAPTGDGLHPNLDGYTLTLPLIENFLKYKI